MVVELHRHGPYLLRVHLLGVLEQEVEEVVQEQVVQVLLLEEP